MRIFWILFIFPLFSGTHVQLDMYTWSMMINVWFLPVFRLPWSSLVWLIFGQHPKLNFLWISCEFSMLCHHEPGGLNWFSWKENQSPNCHEFSAVFHSCQKASRCYADGIGILVASCYNLCCLVFLLGHWWHCVKNEQWPSQRGAGNSGNLLSWSLLSPNFYWPSVVLRCFARRCSFASQKVCRKGNDHGNRERVSNPRGLELFLFHDFKISHIFIYFS